MTDFRGEQGATGARESDESVQDKCGMPIAKRVPKERVFHGDTFIDEYEWLRDKESHDVQDYVAAQNRYCEQRMEPLKTLRSTLFDELKSHVQENDMSVPTRMDGYWYFVRTQEGQQYAVQCRVPIRSADDWDPPTIEIGVPIDGEQVVFDTNAEAQGHDFFRIGGMDISKDGRWMLYGTDTSGDERYDFRIRSLETGKELPEVFKGIGGACFTPDAQWVFYVKLDDAWRPYAVMRHRVGTPVTDDVEVYHEQDERFWVGIGLSFDERNLVIGTGSKTTTEVLLLSTDDPEGEFRAFIPREQDVEYDVSFSRFEGAGERGEDIPLAVVYHNALNPNFEIDVIDMRSHEPPYRLGEGVRVAVGSPYGCEYGDEVEPGASGMPIGTPYSNPCNPAILQGAHGLGIEGISIHRHYVALQYRAESLTHIAVMTKDAAAEDFLAGRPWKFTELVPHALEDDWDVDESVDEINEERAEVWGALDQLAAAQGEGSAVHGVSRKAMTSSDGATADAMPGETRRLYSIQQLGMLHAVDDGAQLLKAAAYLAALSGHGLQKDRGRLAGAEDVVERLGDQLNADLRALLDVAAGVEVIEAAGEVLQPREIVRHGVFGELPQLGVRGAGVQRVGCVGQNGEEAVLRGKRAVGRGVRLVDGLGRAAPGIAGKKLKGVGADLRRRFSHGQKSLGRGEMTSDFEHEGSFPMCWFSPTGPGRPAA